MMPMGYMRHFSVDARRSYTVHHVEAGARCSARVVAHFEFECMREAVGCSRGGCHCASHSTVAAGKENNSP
jgi:hypothetical protein